MPDGKGAKGKGARGKGRRATGDGRQGTARTVLFAPTPDPRPPTPSLRLSVAVVGAGRLGTALARALAAAGCEIGAVVARRAASARRASALVGTNPPALPAAQLERLPAVDLLLLTTPDDALAEVVGRLAALGEDGGTRARQKAGAQRGADARGRGGDASATRIGRVVALHASGALGSEVLAPLRARGYAVGSLHPLVSVSDARAGAEIFRGAFYCVEGDPAAVRLARRLAGALGGRSFTVATDRKALYHAAAVMTSGHTVALFDTAARLLARCGLTPARARQVLLPLLRSTFENLSALPPARALTGTYARADADTVRKHLSALAAAGDPDALAVYVLLGRLSLQLAAEAGADDASLKEIARLLDDSVKIPR